MSLTVDGSVATFFRGDEVEASILVRVDPEDGAVSFEGGSSFHRHSADDLGGGAVKTDWWPEISDPTNPGDTLILRAMVDVEVGSINRSGGAHVARVSFALMPGKMQDVTFEFRSDMSAEDRQKYQAAIFGALRAVLGHPA